MSGLTKHKWNPDETEEENRIYKPKADIAWKKMVMVHRLWSQSWEEKGSMVERIRATGML